MFQNHFLIKLILTPLLIATATLVARRWGERIGGLIVGLPLTSAPVSVFFALEQGRQFAAGAAKGAILGLIPTAVFCVDYAQSARRFPWYASAALSISLYLVTVWGIAQLTPDLNTVAVLVPLVLCAALFLLGKKQPPVQRAAAPRWELPMRMVIATAILLLITTAAGLLGPNWSGLLSPFPIFTFVMVTFSHSRSGPAAAGQLIRGVLTGLFSYTAFFLVVGALIMKDPLLTVYPLATLAALSVNGLSLALVITRARPAFSEQ